MVVFNEVLRWEAKDDCTVSGIPEHFDHRVGFLVSCFSLSYAIVESACRVFGPGAPGKGPGDKYIFLFMPQVDTNNLPEATSILFSFSIASQGWILKAIISLHTKAIHSVDAITFQYTNLYAESEAPGQTGFLVFLPGKIDLVELTARHAWIKWIVIYMAHIVCPIQLLRHELTE